jgi:hypothetical protein
MQEHLYGTAGTHPPPHASSAEATHLPTVLEQAMAAKVQEAAQIEASGHITDDEPLPTSVSTLEEQYEAWEMIARALSDIQTALNRIAQAEQQSIQR